MADRLGPNCAQVTWVLGRLADLGVENWRALAAATHDAEREDELQDAIVRVKRIEPATDRDDLHRRGRGGEFRNCG